MLPNVSASLSAAAKAWEAEFVVFTEPLKKSWLSFSPHKLLLNDFLEGAHKEVVYCDSDILIRSDCPSPFKMMPRRRGAWMIGVADEQFLNARSQANLLSVKAYEAACHRDFKVDLSSFINGGFLAWRYPDSQEIFETATHLVDEADGCNIDCWEQAALNIAIQKSRAVTILLPATFNRLGAIHELQLDTRMQDFVYHAAGRPYGAMLENRNWQAPAPLYLARILPWLTFAIWKTVFLVFGRCLSIDLRKEVVSAELASRVQRIKYVLNKFIRRTRSSAVKSH